MLPASFAIFATFAVTNFYLTAEYTEFYMVNLVGNSIFPLLYILFFQDITDIGE